MGAPWSCTRDLGQMLEAPMRAECERSMQRFVHESTFATVRIRQRVTKGAGSRKAGLAMAYRLRLLAERSCRRLNGHHLLSLVRAGVLFKDGARVERGDDALMRHVGHRRASRDGRRPRRGVAP